MKVSPGTAGTTERKGYREIRVVPPAGRGPFIHLKKWKKVRCQKSKICGKAVPYVFGFHYLCSIQDVLRLIQVSRIGCPLAQKRVRKEFLPHPILAFHLYLTQIIRSVR